MLTLAPAERIDVVVDFRAFDNEVVLTNDRRPVLQFRPRRGLNTDDSSLPSILRPVSTVEEAPSTIVRTHMLGEVQNLLEQPVRMLINSTRWRDPATERPMLGSTEIWNLANVTDDSHPIHLHLVRFRILDRQQFDPITFFNHGRVVFTGPRMQPDPWEAGWKDTVRAEPGMITRIAVMFDGYAGMYMWHCHILEHSDNEMMRPLEIVDRAGTSDRGTGHRAM
jgi:spore coat protein A